MSEKRRDQKGRILRTGESQRKDLIYQYRYTNTQGKRITVYASTLNELRQKEDEIQAKLRIGVDYDKGTITVGELLQRYLSVKQGVRPQTMQAYQYFAKMVTKYPINSKQIASVKMSDAKKWMIELYTNGVAFNTIKHIHSLCKSAFTMAYEEDAISKNPFNFKLDMVPNDTKARQSLSPKQQEDLRNFFTFQPRYKHLYDIYIILLGTGLRVSELCGLIVSDLDFENHKIHVSRQVLRNKRGERFVSPPKSKNGVRDIPMSPEVELSIKSVLEKRKIKTPQSIGGYSDFVFLNKEGRVKTEDNIESSFRLASKKFNELHPDAPIQVTPHVLRHTFCTNLSSKGINIKSLQYLMGHSSVKLTLDLYSHVDYVQAEDAFFNVLSKK